MVFCDIGNTTFHFKFKNKDFKISHKEKLPKLSGTIYFVSVNQKGTNKLLDKYPKAINIETILEFKTKYSGMGIDRKIACLNINNGIVVDAGSAITVDIIKKGKHKGGFILPGLHSYNSIYPKISKKLKFQFDKKIKLDKLPLDTNTAINYAILKSIITPIKDISKDQNITFTGGDGKLISKFFENATYNKNLIFDNIKLVLDKMPQR